MFKKVATPVFGIVEDMTYFLCLPCADAARSSAIMVPDKKRAARHGASWRSAGSQARATSDGRSPITVSKPDNPQVLVFRHIAGRIYEKVSAHAEQRATCIVIH